MLACPSHSCTLAMSALCARVLVSPDRITSYACANTPDVYVFVFSNFHISERMNLRTLLYPLLQQLLDKVREIGCRVRIFQKTGCCFLGLFAQQHGGGLIVRIAALAGRPSSPPHLLTSQGRAWKCGRFFRFRSVFELGE